MCRKTSGSGRIWMSELSKFIFSVIEKEIFRLSWKTQFAFFWLAFYLFNCLYSFFILIIASSADINFYNDKGSNSMISNGCSLNLFDFDFSFIFVQYLICCFWNFLFSPFSALKQNFTHYLVEKSWIKFM